MVLNNLEYIITNIGDILVIINKEKSNDGVIYSGTTLFDDMNITIKTPTKESCIEGVKNAFEIQMHFWLSNQLKKINIKTYGL